jgi:hypothetical protein
VIRLRLGVPQAVYNLRCLATYRREFGEEPFSRLVVQASSDTNMAEAIAAALDQFDTNDKSTA